MNKGLSTKLPPITYQLSPNQGFTLIEVLVTLGLFIFVVSFALGVGLDTFARTSINDERDTAIYLLSKARARSLNNINQTTHGLHIDNANSKFIIFEGNSYTAGDPDNEETPYNDSFIFSGTLEYRFSQLAGATTPGKITITGTGGSKEIDINSEGAIIW